MRRVGSWVLGLLLGMLAAAQLDTLTASTRGLLSLVAWFLSLIVMAFVAVSVVTALETLFPPRVRVRVRVRDRH
jgi:hypothetical protein